MRFFNSKITMTWTRCIGLLLLFTLGMAAHNASSLELAASDAAPVGASGQIRSMLWVGNSFFYYNNGMHEHVNRLLRVQTDESKRHAHNASATQRGARLHWHNMASYFQPDTAQSDALPDESAASVGTRNTHPDAVMMMDCSRCPVDPKLKFNFHEYAGKHSDTVRLHGAQPILFMSWAYLGKPEMTTPLAAEYTQAGQANHALVVPAGLAFAESLAKRPDIPLIMADKRHPTLQGTYLGACTVLASVYKVNPVGNTYTADLPADVAAHLQAVAWETVQKYHAQHGRGSL